MKGVYAIILLIMLSVAGQSQGVAGKTMAYEVFLQSNLIHGELLKAPVPAKYKSCKINVIDSSYLSEPGIVKSSVSETIAATYNSDGVPTELVYRFKSNRGEISSTVKYSYSDSSTFIREIRSDYMNCFLFTKAANGHYLSSSKWALALDQDTTGKVAETRNWWTLNVLGFDSVTTSEFRGRKTFTIRLSSFTKKDEVYDCDYDRVDYPYDTINGKPMISGMHRIYTFDAMHKMTNYKSSRDYSSTTIEDSYTYSAQGLLIEEYFISRSSSELYREHIIITRDSAGFIKQMKFQTPYATLSYSFSWL